MNIIYNNNEAYLKIKGHIFYLRNGFKVNGKIIFAQCSADTGHGIIKEYLPQGYSLSKKKINGKMYYVISCNEYFKYNTNAENSPPMVFISMTLEGAQYLAKKYILENSGLDVTAENLENVVRWLYDSELTMTNKQQQFHGILVTEILYAIQRMREIYG